MDAAAVGEVVIAKTERGACVDAAAGRRNDGLDVAGRSPCFSITAACRIVPPQNKATQCIVVAAGHAHVSKNQRLVQRSAAEMFSCCFHAGEPQASAFLLPASKL